MTYSTIEIRLGGLSVDIQTDLAYPDALDDLCARTLSVFKESMQAAIANGIDITVMRFDTIDYEEDSDE